MLQSVLKKVAGTREEAMISVMLLRSMRQAKYDARSLGHFGLAAKYYTHFTSPIRRYPDLFVHRLIRHYAEDGTGKDAQEKYADIIPEIAEHTSQLERRAIDTERDVDSMKKAEYMGDHIGEQFNAMVSSVMKFGLFVELENTIEGLIHISTMKDDYYEYVENQMALVGRNTHRTFQIGLPVAVKLMRVEKDQAEVDFELLHPEKTPTSEIKLPPRQSFNRNKGGQRNGNRNRRQNGQRSNNSNNKPFYKDKNVKRFSKNTSHKK
jgi:ribonuclease R